MSAAVRRPSAVVTVPFSSSDDTAVDWAVEQFERSGEPGPLVVVPFDPRAVSAADYAELRVRFAHRLAGRFSVAVGKTGLWFVALPEAVQ